LLSEYGAQQLFFRRKLCLSFRSHFADKNVARPHGGSDADNAALVEIAQEAFREELQAFMAAECDRRLSRDAYGNLAAAPQ